ncbi:hypothetical protein P4K96_18310 [Bacillus cereus]|nr:hypothetical protein [Bacillus cereus]
MSKIANFFFWGMGIVSFIKTILGVTLLVQNEIGSKEIVESAAFCLTSLVGILVSKKLIRVEQHRSIQ